MNDWLARHRTGHPICAGGTGGAGRTRDDLIRDARSIARELPPPEPGSHVALVFGSDRYACAAALFGAWVAGHAVALPPDVSRAAVAPVLARDDVVAVLHDTGVGLGLDVPRFLNERRFAAPCDAIPVRCEHAATLFGGGERTGRPIETWTIGSLVQESEALGARFALEPGRVVACTLTPTHPAGLLLGLLAPLRAGARFVAEPIPPSAAGARALRAAAADVLVSGPFHLARLAALEAGELATLARVVSATGRVDRTTSERLIASHRLPAVELDPLSGEDADPISIALLATGATDDAAALPMPAGAASSARTIRAIVPTRGAGGIPPASPDSAVCILPFLPRDANGELLGADLLAMLGRDANGRPLRRDVEWEDGGGTSDGIARVHGFRTRVPDDYLYFSGHFPTYPVLAGAVQLQQIVLPCVRRVRPDLGALARVSALKFTGRIGPGDALEVVVRSEDGSPRVAFEIRHDGARATTGTLEFAAPAPLPLPRKSR